MPCAQGVRKILATNRRACTGEAYAKIFMCCATTETSVFCAESPPSAGDEHTFCQAGYMFPQTKHVETLVCLTRNIEIEKSNAVKKEKK
ncbi:MAG: hypothetical protein IJX75_02995 [Clostridia bacterium]|nr:hypothetical protein [Clostridia bacterium]